MEKKLRLSPKGTFRFCILFAAALLCWDFFRSYFLLLALAVMAGSPIFSFLALWFSRDMLCVDVMMPINRVGRCTEFSLGIFVRNPRRFVSFTADVTYSWSNLFTGYSERSSQRLWVAPAGGSQISQLLKSRYAGRVEVRIEAVEIYDLFHIFCLRGCGKTDGCVLVWPGFAETAKEELPGCVENFPGENETKKRGTDFNPDYEIREYIAGDELKSIHWKLSAKQGKMMVRERLASGREKINVLLPLGEDKAENDGLMESLYALGRLLLEKEYPIQLYWPGRDNALRGCFAAELGELENALGEILSDSGLRFAGEAEEQMAVEHSGESYILVRTGVYKGAYIR